MQEFVILSEAKNPGSSSQLGSPKTPLRGFFAAPRMTALVEVS